MFKSCPICGKAPVEPIFTDRIVCGVIADKTEPSPLLNVRLYACQPNGHIVVVGTNGSNGHAKEAGQSRSAAPVLNSWKEIAGYMGRGVRTVQRWEQRLGLPVHRPQGRDRSAVLAMREEVDAWLAQTPVRANGNSNGNGQIKDAAAA